MKIFRSLWYIVSSKATWINVLITAVFLLLLLVGIFRYLKSYTGHGESVTVPPLRGMTWEEAQAFVADKQVSLFVIDSIFNPEMKPGEVINQTPEAGSKVKEGRRIYLTIRSYLAEEAPLPDVEGISLRNAVSKLQNAGFLAGERIYRPYKYNNAVLYVSLDGEKIEPGRMYPKGTTFELVVGNGLGDTKVSVPNLIGNTLQEAEFILLGGYNLNIGIATFDATVFSKADSLQAVIHRQDPEPDGGLRVGEFVNVYLMSKEAFQDKMDSILFAPRDSLLIDNEF